MHIPVLKQEVWPLPQTVVGFILRYEFLWSVQSFRGARFLLIVPLRSGRDRPVGSPSSSDGLFRRLILFPRDKIIFPLFIP